MRLIFIGDVVGKAGREALKTYLPGVRQEFSPDFVVVNAENASHGHGLIRKHYKDIIESGADCLTMGNHTWDKKDILSFIDLPETMIVRPANYPSGTPGKGGRIIVNSDGQRLLVMNALGRIYMSAVESPFGSINRILNEYRHGRDYDAAFIDFHAELTSEKQAFGRYFDGKVAAVVGTHTHVPTSDYRILRHGTAYQTDAGMTGCYDGVLGFDDRVPIKRIVNVSKDGHFKPLESEGAVSGVIVDVDRETGNAKSIQPLRRGAHLPNN